MGVPNRRKRKTLRTLGAAGLIGLAGCVGGNSGDGNSNNTSSSANESSSGSSDAVEWWNLWVQGSTKKAADGLVSRFEDKTGITVNQTKYENTPYKSAITNALGTSNAPDLFYIWPGPNRLGRYVKNKNVISLDNHFSEKELENRLSSSIRGTRYKPGDILSWRSKNGSIFGQPLDMTPIPIYYNKKVLNDSGIDPGELKHSTDTTWERYLEICQKVSDAGHQPIVTGNRNRWPVGHAISAFMIKAVGVDAYLNTAYGLNERSFTDKPFVEALSRLKSLYKKNYINRSVNSINNNEAAAMIFNNQAAFYHSPNILEVLSGQAPDSFGGIPDQMDYMWWPYFPDLYEDGNNERLGLTAGSVMSVSTQAKQRGDKNFQNTIEFMDYLGSAEAQQYWFEQTSSPVTRTDVYGNVEMSKMQETLTETANQIQNSAATGPVFDVAFLPETTEALLSSGQKLFTGTSPKSVLKNVQNANEKAISNVQ